MHKVGLIALAVAAAAACKNEPPAVAVISADAAPIIDPARSYLTDEKMAHFVESMRAEPNPFDFLFRGVTEGDAGFPVEGRVEQMTAFARSHGMADADEYFRIWTLVQLARMLELVDSVGDMGGEATKMLEERLQRPDLPETERREVETQLAVMKKLFAARATPTSVLSANDLAILRKFQPDIDAALAGWRGNP